MKKYSNGEYIDITPSEEDEFNNSIPDTFKEPTREDILEAQILYTALMTDTLISEE